MKQVIVVALGLALAGCATEKNVFDMRPSDKDGVPSGVVWQNDHDKELAAAMKPEALAEYVKTPAAAAALLAEVKPAYATDAMTATRIGAVTQLVMTPGCAKAAAARTIWVEALLAAAETSTDSYRTMFFLDQLRWCATSAAVDRVTAIGALAKDQAVKDFAAWVVRELK